jgi:hypothetical protein
VIRRLLAVVGLVLFLGAFAWLADRAVHPEHAGLERTGPERTELERAGLAQPSLDRPDLVQPAADDPAAEPGP